jgi:branched-chain amino acid transport system substrate-binding protein
MKKSIRKRWIGVLLVALVLGLATSVRAERPIRILMTDPLSGPAKDLGERSLQGIQFAVEEFNAQGGLQGRKVEVVAEDSQTKPDIAARKAQKYLLEHSVDFICAGYGTPVAKAMNDLAAQHNIIFIYYSMSDESTGKDFSYHSIRLVYNTSMIARTLVHYVANHTQFKKIYLLNQDYSYGRDMAAALKKEIGKQMPGAQIVGEDYNPFFAKDFSSFLSKIKAANADCILTANWGPDISILMKQRSELGVKAVVVNNALSDPLVIGGLPEAAQGSIVSDAYMKTVNTPESIDFVKRWQKRYKGTTYPDPDTISGRSYIGTKFLLEGIKKAQSVEVKKLIPVLEGMHQKSLNGEIYLRACDHQMQSPLPVAVINSKTYPYVGVPTMIPASAIAIEESAIDNPRCKKK